jgi:hypothetical protein
MILSATRPGIASSRERTFAGDVPTPGLLVGSTIVVASGLYILWRETLRRRRPAVRAPQRA